MARSFGAPGVLAECAAPLLQVGGLLVVSEPPLEQVPEERSEVGHPDRWPVGPLAELGLGLAGFIHAGFGYQRLRQQSPCPERFPRRDGMPAKRPLF